MAGPVRRAAMIASAGRQRRHSVGSAPRGLAGSSGPAAHARLRPPPQAVAISLVSVIVTSSAGAGVCLRARRKPPRETSSYSGLAPSSAASSRSPCRPVLEGLFAALLVVAFNCSAPDAAAPSTAPPTMCRRPPRRRPAAAQPQSLPPLILPFALSSGFVTGCLRRGRRRCRVRLHCSAGASWVPLMNLAMGVPLKVATATSSVMIGITAARPP